MPRKPDVLSGAKNLTQSGAFWAWRLLTRHHVDGRLYSGFIAASTYTPWRADQDFMRLHAVVEANTLVDVTRLYELYSLTHQLAAVDGDILEVGVWRGGSGCLMAARSAVDGSKARVFLADTFTGVVKATERDPIYQGGEHADASVETVKDLASSMGLRNVELLVGIFPDDTAQVVEHRSFKLVHVDVDTYGSAEQVTRWAWPRLVVGGVVVFDDYGTPTTSGVREFVDEFRGTPDSLVIHNLNQHAIIVKTG